MPPAELTLSQAVVSGALAGAVAANTMTVLRMAARRRGWIDKTIPQLMEEWLLRRLGVDLPGGHLAHHALDQGLHVGFGSLMGALDGLAFYALPPVTLRRGLTLGAATWAFSGLVLVPALGAGKSILASSLPENAVNLGAHVLFGLSTAVLTQELFEQIERGPTSTHHRVGQRTG